MFATLRFLLVTLGGVLLGLASVWWAVGHLQFEGGGAIGRWMLIDGGPAGNPYEAARAARRGSGGLGPSEGIELVTEVDRDGQSLRSGCPYVVSGPMPQGLLWTLTVTDRDGRLPTGPANRVGFTSQDALAFGVARQIHISIGPDVRPGDFVPTTGLTSLRLTIRLYSPTVASRLPTPEQLPTVAPLSCDTARRS